MDLAQLANFGEFVGGLAVLVTLVYLALQVRQGNDLAREEAIHRAVNTWSVSRQLRADASVSGVLAKAYDDQELTLQEKIQLRGYLDELVYASWSVYVNPRVASSSHIAPEAVARLIGHTQIWRDAWAEMDAELREHGLSDFASEVSRRLEARR